MKHRIASVIVGVCLCVMQGTLFGAETNSPVISDLNDLITRINVKLQAGKQTEQDLADNIKEFDVLLAKHKGEDPREVAQIPLMEVQLYLEVLHEPDKAVEVLKQMKRELPGYEVNGDSDATIKLLQDMVAKQKLRESLVAGAQFPDFHVTGLSGKPLSVSEYKGKVVLVDFWATWCPPCLAALPDVLATYQKYHDQGFDIIGISLDESKGRLQSFIADKKMPWRQYFDGKKWDNELAVKYGIDAIPAAYLLDRNGKIIASDLEGDELEAAVAKALKEK